ncbi:MAG: metal ABC transporter ATP-binding protein [Alphaproteobacteria bacterium]
MWLNPFQVRSNHTYDSPQSVKCSDLHIKYKDFLAVENLTGTFSAGSLTAIVGPNGGGKSTLLKAIKGVMPASKGRIEYGDLSSRHDIAYLPQASNVDRSFPLYASDVVAMGLSTSTGFFKRVSSVDQDRIALAMDRVQLKDSLSKPIHALSGGQFQRLLFARLSLQDAPVVLLDEPFAAIDAPTMDILAQLLCDWRDEGKTVIAVLHDLDIVREFFPSTLILARRCIAWGRTDQVLQLKNIRQAKDSMCQWSFNPDIICPVVPDAAAAVG